MTYKIEKGIPAPRPKVTTIGPERLALDELEPGDSVLFPADRARFARSAAVNKRSKNKAWTYTARKQPDGNFRVWRLT